ncbi:substrate-binding domain-containing protein [Bacillota bacterium Meth-B3]|nr:substrate-binding domain-containing protein [Christensenellaceae bacterium]MEA5066883.1 substrate-binding domain-containing protein [Eubacteriales bacterium]
MKKLIAAVLTLMLALSLFAVSAVAEAKAEVNVAYIAKNTVDAFHATLNNAAKESLDALVADGTIAKWQLYDGLTDPITQVNLIEDAINNGANFVVLLPAESQGSAPVVTRCKDAGIPIVVINSKTNNTDELANAFVGSNDVQAGEMMATFVKEQVPDGGKYAHMMGIVGNSAQIDRGQGIKNIMDGDAKWEAVGDFAADWSADKAVQFATDAVNKYGAELKAIICDNDDMSSAVQAYCNSVERSDIVCIGVDGNQGPLTMVKQGALRATILQDGAGQVKAGIALIPDILAGKEVEKSIMIPFVQVDAANVDQFLK